MAAHKLMAAQKLKGSQPLSVEITEGTTVCAELPRGHGLPAKGFQAQVAWP
jgi:hypothetical protein